MPPLPISTFYYTCNAQFYVDLLYNLIGEQDIYGIINIEAGEAAIGTLRGYSLKLHKSYQSGIEGKHGKGGSSQGRMMRLHDEHVLTFCRYIGEKANKYFVLMEELKGLLISGAGQTKLLFAKEGNLDYRLKQKILAIIDTGYSGFNGIRETFQRANGLLANLKYVKEKEVMQKFLFFLAKNSSKIAYGKKEVTELLSQGRVETVIASENLPQDEIEQLITISQSTKAQFTIISSDTEEGNMLWQTFGGYGAFLRY